MNRLLHHMVFLYFLGMTEATGQTRFDHFTVENGLAQNSILSIIQDRTGYLWIGTEDGLHRFDGYTFKKYRAIPGDSTSLPDNVIWSLLEDDLGRIWIGHSKGISYLDPTNQRFKNIYLGKNLVAVSALQDSHKNMWFGTTGSGLIQIANDDLEVSQFVNDIIPPAGFDKQARSVLSNTIISIYEDEEGLIVGTRGAGLFAFRDGKFSRIDTSPDFLDFLEHNVCWSIVKSDDDNFYLGTLNGLGIFKPDFKSGRVYTTSPESNSLSENNVTQVLPDQKRDGLWIATYGGGLNYLDLQSERFISYRRSHSDPSSLSSDVTFRLLLDRNQNLWIGTIDGGLNRLNRNALLFNILDSRNGFSDNFITGIDSSGDSVFVATLSGGVYLSTDQLTFRRVTLKNPPNLEYINSVDFKSKLWLAMEGTGVAFADKKLSGEWQYLKRIPFNEHSLNNLLVSLVYEDPFGTLWAGTNGSGLNRIYLDIPFGKPGCIQHFNSDAIDSRSLSGNVIKSLLIDKTSHVWVGTDNGLNRSVNRVGSDLMADEFYRFGGGKIISLNEVHDTLWVGTDAGLFRMIEGELVPVPGFEQDFICTIVPDGTNAVWVSTNHGVLRLQRDGNLQRFTVSDGLQSNEFYGRAGTLTANGKIFFGGVNGLNGFDPQAFRAREPPPPVVITKIVLNNHQEIEDHDNIVLNYRDKFIEFEFAALDFTNPALNQYQYQLQGFDQTWNTVSASRRSVTYTNLDPGRYTFNVKGSNSQGTWNEVGRSITLEVLPPPWATGWAYTGYGALLLGVVLFARKNIINRERLKAKLKLEHLEVEKLKELDEFKSKFFANISHEFRTPLTLIMGQADEVLEQNKFSSTALQSIRNNSKALLGLVNQMLDLSRIDAGKLELQISAVKLKEFLRVHVNAFQSWAHQKGLELIEEYPEQEMEVGIDASILEKILHNLLSNAVKYTPHGGKVFVNASVQADSLMLKISDTGIGIETKDLRRIFERFYRVSEHNEGTGIGLALTKELVKLHGGTVHVESKVGKGTIFIVQIQLYAPQAAARSVIADYQSEPDVELGTNENGDHQDLEISSHALPSLLIVEDNEELRVFIKRNLQNEFSIALAPDGEKGLQLARQTVPDIVVTDWMMPGMSGVDLCEKLKADEATSHIPVIMLTAKANVESKLHGLETGADDYLTKPFEMRELRARLTNIIHQRSLLRDKFSKEGLTGYKKLKVSSLDQKFMENFLKTLEDQFSNPALSVEGLSREMGVSRVQLHRKLTALTGQAASDLIRAHRLQRAAELLRLNVGNVSEIAFMVGFENLSYFTKAFRLRYKCTPSEYRQSPKS